MTAHSYNRNDKALNDADLDLVTGGASTPTQVSPALLAAEKLPLINLIHLPPLPPLHVAFPHK